MKKPEIYRDQKGKFRACYCNCNDDFLTVLKLQDDGVDHEYPTYNAFCSVCKMNLWYYPDSSMRPERRNSNVRS